METDVGVQKFRSIEEMNRAPAVTRAGADFEQFLRHCARYRAIATAQLNPPQTGGPEPVGWGLATIVRDTRERVMSQGKMRPARSDGPGRTNDVTSSPVDA